MFSLRLLLICGWLLLLIPARPPSAQPLGCSLAQLPGLGQYIMHTDDIQVPIGNSMLTLRICAQNKESLTADETLQFLAGALPKLHEHAGLPLKGSLHRTVVLVERDDLQKLNFEGMLTADGIIYVHPKSPPWTIVHEGAHYWSNPTNFEDRWLVEGYADYLTKLVMEDLGRSDTLPAPQPICDGKPLLSWDYEPEETARCGYDVGAAVFHAVEQQIGRDQLRATMKRLGEKSKPVTSWQLLIALEGDSGRDLTDLFKQAVFPLDSHPVLEERRALWQTYRAAAKLADPLRIELPAYIGIEIDRLEFASANAMLSAVLPLLQAAISVSERCQMEQLVCARPWQSLPADPHAWPPITAHLVEAHNLLQSYTRLRETASQARIELPAPLVQSVAELQMDAAPRIAGALNVLNMLPTLESRCRQMELACRDYWIGAWQAEEMGTVSTTIEWLTTVTTRADLVERRCGEALSVCRDFWKASLDNGPDAPQRALEELTTLLDQSAGLDRICEGIGWSCRRGLAAALASGGVDGAAGFIEQAQQRLPEVEKIAQSTSPEQSAPLNMFSRMIDPGDAPFMSLDEARQAFEQGDIQAAYARAKAARQAQQQIEQRQTAILRLASMGGIALACLILAILLARAIRGSRRRSTP